MGSNEECRRNRWGRKEVRYTVQKIPHYEWTRYMSENAHLIVFDEKRPKDMERIDFALLCTDESDTPLTYVTCRELDSETLYWQFGGSFPGTKGTTKSYHSYIHTTEACWDLGYKRITTLIENTNCVMIKFAMKIGYKIIGIRNFKNHIMLEHLLEKED